MNLQRGFTVGELLVGVFLVFVLGIFALPYILRSEVVGCGGDAPATVRVLSTRTNYLHYKFSRCRFCS
jgi:competence protein ComGC